MGSLTRLLFTSTKTLECSQPPNGPTTCREADPHKRASTSQTSCGWLQAPGFSRLREVKLPNGGDCEALLADLVHSMKRAVENEPTLLDRFKHPDEETARHLMGGRPDFGKVTLNLGTIGREIALFSTWTQLPTQRCGVFQGPTHAVEVRRLTSSEAPCKLLIDFAQAVSSSTLGPTTVVKTKNGFEKVPFPFVWPPLRREKV